MNAICYSTELADSDMDNIVNGEYQLVYFSPEALLNSERWREMLLNPVYQENLIGLNCPDHVRMMALTATATKNTRISICHKLGMIRPFVIAKPPNRVNIKYIIATPLCTLEDTFTPLVENLRTSRLNFERTIIYGRSYDACSSIYLLFSVTTRTRHDRPCWEHGPGKKSLSGHVYCTYYIKCQGLHSTVICQNQHVIIATVAFGMGIDCPDVCCVIHWGLPRMWSSISKRLAELVVMDYLQRLYCTMKM